VVYLVEVVGNLKFLLFIQGLYFDFFQITKGLKTNSYYISVPIFSFFPPAIYLKTSEYLGVNNLFLLPIMYITHCWIFAVSS